MRLWVEKLSHCTVTYTHGIQLLAVARSGLVMKVVYRSLLKISIHIYLLCFPEYTIVNSIICSAKSLAITLCCVLC